MKHFLTKLGGIFHKDIHGQTPFQIVCKKYEKEEAATLIDNTFYGQQNVDTDFIKKALVYAATERVVDLKAVYFLLRREPAALEQATAGKTDAF